MKPTSSVVTTQSERDTLLSFSRLMLWTSLFTLGVIIFGSAVRATDSGMGCPDWPLCYDQIVPSAFDTQVFFEWFHRLIAGVLAVMFAVAAVRVFRRPQLRRIFGAQLTVGGVLLAIQIILGGLTVLKLLDPKTVSAHLINATLFYGLLVWTTVKAWTLSRDPTPQSTPPAFQFASIAFLALIFVQIFLGGMVSSNYAGLSCLSFPRCGEQWWPAESFAVNIHMTHRLMGGITFLASLLLLIVGRRLSPANALPQATRISLWLVPILICVQIGLGVGNVYWQLPDWASVLHLAVAQLIFTTALISVAMIRLRSRSFAQPMVDTDRRKQALTDPSFVAGT